MIEIASIEYSEYRSRILMVNSNEVIPKDVNLCVFDGNTVTLFPERDYERSLTLAPGEAAKAWVSVESILNRALALSLGRDGLIAGVGGGALTDVCAFAASIYMRGCRLILIPTTLLAMVDAAIGGKTGFDYGNVKNLVGTFYPAEEVRICPALLKTLPDREYRSGMAEVLKHAMLDPDMKEGMWDMLTKRRDEILARQESVLNELIPKAIMVKVNIVSEDLREQGKRMFLNLGHTFAHALETATRFSLWSHGEAVAWGILKALELGQLLGLTDPYWADECRHLFDEYSFKLVNPQFDPALIKSAMVDDKKKKDGRLRFVLMESLGKPILQEVPEKELDIVLGINS